MYSRRLLGMGLGSVLFAACSPESSGIQYSPSLTEVRTGEVEVEEEVVIPEDLYVPGIVINTEYDSSEGAVDGKTDLSGMEDLADPVALKEHATYAYTVADGDLIDQNREKALSYDDVQQGAIGDCYFVAALSAVLFADNDNAVREGLVREVDGADGRVARFAVRFYDYRGVPQDVEVDAQLVRSGSRPVYARSADSVSGQEEWGISLVEKAYAQWRGSFDKIGNGGYPGDVMQALTGSTATYRTSVSMSDEELVRSITASMADSRPMTACTYGENDGVDYSGTGVYAHHCYSVHGAHLDDNRQAVVKLRNPWGSSEPAGNGPNDGIFELKSDLFKRLYQGVNYGGRGKVDVVAPAAVTDLDYLDPYHDGAVVGFTAPGDDGRKGMAFAYDFRISNQVITNENFYSATSVPMAGPLAPEEVEFVDLHGLGAGTWYIAVKTEDEAGNISGLSNVASFTVSSVP